MLHDERRAPFFYVTVTVAQAIRQRFAGKERTTAIAIYAALAEIANEHRARDFRATRAEIAEYAGTSDRSVDRYTDEFERIGILGVTRERVGRLNLPNRWSLLEPEGGEAASGGGGEANSPRGEAASGGGGEANGTPTQEAKERNEGQEVESEFPEHVVELVDLMAERVAVWTDSEKKTPGRAWYVEMDRMIRLDGRAPEEVWACILWLDRGEGDAGFWKTVVLSVPKLREKFAQLKAVARRSKTNHNGRAGREAAAAVLRGERSYE